MTNVEKLLNDLYEMLLRLRYPGIAQINCEDMKEIVLGHDNRLFLLSWLLTQSSMIKSEEFSIDTEESKLVKWFSNMGICSTPDILMGRVPLLDQIPALQNLLLFMRNVLASEESNGNFIDQSSVTDILKKRMSENINIIPSTCSLTSKLNYNEAIEYLKGRRKSLSERKSLIAESPASMKRDKSPHEAFGSKGRHSSTFDQESGRAATVEKFVQAFKSGSTWPLSKTADSMSSKKKSMDDDIVCVHSGMVTLKETLHSKDQVSNFEMMEKLETRGMPLDGIIEDIVIRIEELIRLHDIKDNV